MIGWWGGGGRRRSEGLVWDHRFPFPRLDYEHGWWVWGMWYNLASCKDCFLYISELPDEGFQEEGCLDPHGEEWLCSSRGFLESSTRSVRSKCCR